MSRIRTFSELSRIESFEERYEYLRLKQDPGDQTFGFERYLNQSFYHSADGAKRGRRLSSETTHATSGSRVTTSTVRFSFIT